MKYTILNNIINQLKTDKKTYKKNYKDYNHICFEISETAEHIGNPFVSLDGKTYVYTGSHLEELTKNEVIIFEKFAYQKLCGNTEIACQKDTIKGIEAQFPYTIMGMNVMQVKDKINFSNGTLDLTTGILGPFYWRDYFRYVLPYKYESAASCPMFMKYLNEVMPEPQAQDVLAEYIGWLFTSGLKLEKVLFLYGSGCNGKSVFIDIMEAIVGRDNISHESLSDLCGEHGANSRSNIIGKLLNTCSDVAPNAFAGDIFKRIASQEPISSKILYEDVQTTSDYAKMVFCLNELPKTNDNSNGFYRRFLIAPFLKEIPKSKINPNLAKEIIGKELPGIMNWVLRGRERIVKNQAFTDSPIMQKTLDDYRTSNSKPKHKKSLILPDWLKR